jgi:hypothetical protein
MDRILASEAVKIECRYCDGVESECHKCALGNPELTLKNRIKQFCEMCAPNHNPTECTGNYIGGQARLYAEASLGRVPMVDGKAKCALHSYRLGKELRRCAPISEERRKALAERLQTHRFKKKEPQIGVVKG